MSWEFFEISGLAKRRCAYVLQPPDAFYRHVSAELDGGSEIGVPPGRNSSRAESPDILDLLTRLSAFPLGI